jgi:hypothetical protein
LLLAAALEDQVLVFTAVAVVAAAVCVLLQVLPL